MIMNILNAVTIISFMTYKTSNGDPFEPFEQKTPLQFCSDIKSYMRNFSISDFIKNINDRWQMLYSHAIDSESSNTSNKSCRTCEEKLNESFQECAINTETRTTIMQPIADKKKPKEAGVIDVRTIDQTNANMVIKHRYKKPSCGAMRKLLQCVEAIGFQRMYPNERVIVLAVSFDSKNAIIYEWIALLYEKGEIISAKHSAKCLHFKEFRDLAYNGKPLLQYFENVNEE